MAISSVVQYSAVSVSPPVSSSDTYGSSVSGRFSWIAPDMSASASSASGKSGFMAIG